MTDSVKASKLGWIGGLLAAIAIVLESTRRVIGLSLPLTAIGFLVFALGFTRVTPQVLLEQLYLSTEGIFGSTLGVSASYVMLFVLFGAYALSGPLWWLAQRMRRKPAEVAALEQQPQLFENRDES